MQVYSFAQIVQLTILDLWGRIVAILPDLIGALIILVVGFIVAPLVGGVVKKIIDAVKVDMISEKLGVNDLFQGYTDKFSVSLLIGKLVKWFFVLAFTMAAAEVLGWTRITLFLNEIIFYIPQVLVAVIILALSMVAGKFFQTIVVRSLLGSNTPVDRPDILGAITKWAFVVFGILAALIQLGIATSLIQILFTGIVFALALAFGLGGRKKVEEMLDKVDSPIKKKKSTK